MKYLLCFLLLFCLWSCHDVADSSVSKLEADDAYISVPRSAEPPPPPPGSMEVVEKEAYYLDQNGVASREKVFNEKAKIIQTGRMSAEVEDLEVSKSKVDSMLSVAKGYYQNEEYMTHRYESRYSLILRVPVDRFQMLVNQVSSSSWKITQKNISAEDVTEEFVDLQLRLANNEAYVKRYVELLNRAKKVEDMLAIQEKIRRIEEEIEAKKGRINFLNNQSKYSTLYLSLVVKHPIVETAKDDHFFTKVSTSFVRGYNAVLNVLLILISYWPMILFLSTCLFLFRKYGFIRRKAHVKEV